MNLTDLLTEGAYESRVWIDDVLLQEIGISVLLNSDEPALPALRNSIVNVPGRHGAYDFGAYLEPREFTLNCVFPRQSYTDLKRHIREFNHLFVDEYGRPKTVKLRFGDEPDKYYNVRLTGGIPVERVAERGFITINLTAFDPYAFAGMKAFDKFPGNYDTEVRYDEGLMYENIETFDWYCPIHYVGAFNHSHFATPLNLVIEGEVLNPKITINGKTFAITISVYENERLYVDSKTMQVWKVKNGEEKKINLFEYIKGDFPYLNGNNNYLRFEGHSPNAVVRLNWKHRFL